MMFLQNFAPIPKLFKSDLTGDSFKNCISCEVDLYALEEGYFIEKAIKPYNGFETYATVFEYAMCPHCMEKMRSELSESSKANIDQYFEAKVDLSDRKKRLSEEQVTQEPEIEQWLNQCMVYGTHIYELGECQIFAQCVNDQILFDTAPYMLSGKVGADVLGLLSNKTLDDLNNFSQKLTDGPPEFKKLLEHKKGVFV